MRVRVRQARCSGSGTKLKISSPATCRRSKRSASRKSCFRPLGARLENACAKCKRMYGSNSAQTGFQYSAVDSMTASFTPRSCSQSDKPWRSIVVVPKRRRSSSPFGPRASPSLDPTTTISTFLWTSIDATLFSSDIVSSWRGSGRTRGKIVTHRHVLPPFLPGGAASQRLVQNAHSGSNSETASTYPERRRPSPFHVGFIIQRPPRPDFHPNWWAEGPCNTRNDRLGENSTEFPLGRSAALFLGEEPQRLEAKPCATP